MAESRNTAADRLYYPIYFAKQTPTNWVFRLPKSPFDKSKQESVEGMKFTRRHARHWNMTVTPVAGEFTLGKPAGCFVADKDGRTIRIAGASVSVDLHPAGQR